MLTIIKALVSEHKLLCTAFEQMEQALPKLRLAELKRLARLLESWLLKHAAAEEDLVLLALDRAPGYKRRCNRFHEDHEEIDNHLTQVFVMDDLGQARELLRKVLTHSRAHFTYEERVIFPLIEQVMPAEHLQKLGRLWGWRGDGASETKLDPGSFRKLTSPPTIAAKVPLKSLVEF